MFQISEIPKISNDVAVTIETILLMNLRLKNCVKQIQI